MATLTERRNSKGELTGWKVTACVGRDETYRQVWKTCTIKRDSAEITATTPKAMQKQAQRLADEWAEQQKAEYEQNGKVTKVSKDKVTLANFIRNKWLPLHVNDGEHAATTKAFYNNMADDLIEYFGEHIQLSQIDSEVIKKYQIYLRTKAKTKQNKPYSETTVRRHLETLRNVLSFAVSASSSGKKYLKTNPFADMPITSATKKEETHIDFLTPQEAAAFLEALSSESLQWQCFMRILLYAGLRRGECVALQWQDVDTEQKKIYVRHNCTVDAESKDGFSIGSPKSGKERVVYITQTLCDLIEQYRAEQKNYFKKSDSDKEESIAEWYLFHKPKDPKKTMYPTSPTTWLARFMKKHNMRPISPHDLRHSCGTLQKMAGIADKDIATSLGHSDTSTTNRYYIEADNATQRSIAPAIENLIEHSGGKENERANTEDPRIRNMED